MMTWFDMQALDEEGIVDCYAVDGWLPGSVTLELKRTWA